MRGLWNPAEYMDPSPFGANSSFGELESFSNARSCRDDRWPCRGGDIISFGNASMNASCDAVGKSASVGMSSSVGDGAGFGAGTGTATAGEIAVDGVIGLAGGVLAVTDSPRSWVIICSRRSIFDSISGINFSLASISWN